MHSDERPADSILVPHDVTVGGAKDQSGITTFSSLPRPLQFTGTRNKLACPPPPFFFCRGLLSFNVRVSKQPMLNNLASTDKILLHVAVRGLGWSSRQLRFVFFVVFLTLDIEC